MEQKKFVKFGLSVDNFRAYVQMIEDEVLNFMNTDPQFRAYQMNDINEWGSFHSFKVLAEMLHEAKRLVAHSVNPEGGVPIILDVSR